MLTLPLSELALSSPPPSLSLPLNSSRPFILSHIPFCPLTIKGRDVHIPQLRLFTLHYGERPYISITEQLTGVVQKLAY